MYDILAYHSKPVYGWQYVRGTLMHGSKGAPHLKVFTGPFVIKWTHDPFRGLLERKGGSRQSLDCFCDGALSFLPSSNL